MRKLGGADTTERRAEARRVLDDDVAQSTLGGREQIPVRGSLAARRRVGHPDVDRVSHPERTSARLGIGGRRQHRCAVRLVPLIRLVCPLDPAGGVSVRILDRGTHPVGMSVPGTDRRREPTLAVGPDADRVGDTFRGAVLVRRDDLLLDEVVVGPARHAVRRDVVEGQGDRAVGDRLAGRIDRPWVRSATDLALQAVAGDLAQGAVRADPPIADGRCPGDGPMARKDDDLTAR